MIKKILLSSVLAVSLFAVDTKDLTVSKQEQIGKTVEQVIKVKDYSQDINDLNNALDDLKKNANQNSEKIEELKTKLLNELNIETIKKEVEDSKIDFEKTKTSLNEFITEYDKQIKFNKLTNETVNNIIKIVDQNSQNITKLNGNLKETPDFVKTLELENKSLKDELANLKVIIEKITKDSQDFTTKQNTVNKQIESYVNTKINEDIVSLKNQVKEVESLAKEDIKKLEEKTDTTIVSLDKRIKNIDFNSNIDNHELLLFIIKNMNKINERIDFIQNNVIEYKFNKDFDPSIYSKYEIKSKVAVEYKNEKSEEITSVYFVGNQLIAKKINDNFIETETGVIKLTDVSKIEE